MSPTAQLAALLRERFPSWYGGNTGAAVDPEATAALMARTDAEWLLARGVVVGVPCVKCGAPLVSANPCWNCEAIRAGVLGAVRGTEPSPAHDRAVLELIVDYAQEIQRASVPGDAQDCARHIEDEAKAALRGEPSPPPMGALEAALRGLGCHCHGDTEGHEVTEHLTPGEREVFEWARVAPHEGTGMNDPQQITCARIALRMHGGPMRDENDCACEHCVALRELIALVRVSSGRAPDVHATLNRGLADGLLAKSDREFGASTPTPQEKP
jgi:hypothetical protein